ncbi:hypothetical protein OU798_09255 [Prolixibacteraceae bacterium Z1-6]|uniref:Asparagine synthetase domain-containing protein n=1 Tax=Draconibacterium aestuarii TaxID=2998507 RepID=A0A9X3F643_9BACT|nr:hypothetical protein [Prolixibacteraceae bacterium Z1-6]
MALSFDLILEKFKWFNDKNIFVVGFVWVNNKYVSQQNFVDLVLIQSDFNEFKRFAAALNGQFSIVVQRENEVWLACSHTWTNPVFYKKGTTKYRISDEPENLVNTDSDKEPDPFSALYFLNFGVTPKETTLSYSISQVRPGEVVCLSGSKRLASQVAGFSDLAYDNSSEELTGSELQNHLIESFGKYYEQLKGKQVLLPLTKGYDSRLLACLLAEYGHKDVVCATWGRKDNLEKQTAQKVAAKLGYKYFAVDYTKTMIRNFTKTENFENYVKFVGHWSSMPFFYEYFGLTQLLKNNVINQETVALPGHPGDFLKGSHLNNSMLNFSSNDFCAHVISRFGTFAPIQKSGKNELHNYLAKNYFPRQAESLWQNYEQWDLEERQCKFIGNSSMIFSFLGMRYFMPLFDRATLKLFHSLPFEKRVGEVFYNKTLETNFFKKYHVDFDLKSLPRSSTSSSNLKEAIIGLVPHFLKIHYYPVYDSVFYREITRELRNANKNFEFKHPSRPHYYNSYIVQWYLQYIAQKSNWSSK